jgi:predicted transcriptional regulator
MLLTADAALRLIEEDAEFRAGARRGMAQADRGELIEHEDVKARVEHLLKSR